MEIKHNQAGAAQAAAAYANAGQMKNGLTTPHMPGESGSAGPSFGDLLGETLQKDRSVGYESESISAKAIAGKAQLNDLVSSVTNAELTLDAVVAVRDKMISAYQDIVKMPI